MGEPFVGYKLDSPESIAKCFACTKEECTDCLAYRSPANSGRKDEPKGRGRPVKWTYDKLDKFYTKYWELRDQGIAPMKIIGMMGMSKAGVTRVLKKCEAARAEKNLPIKRRYTESLRWTPEALAEFHEKVKPLRDAGYTWMQLGEHFGCSYVHVYLRYRQYKRMIGEG